MLQTQTIPYYHATGREEEVFTHAFKNKIPFLLKGPTGTGKSRFIEYIGRINWTNGLSPSVATKKPRQPI